MSKWLVEVGLDVIGQGANHHYRVGRDGVVGIRRVNNRYDVVFDNGYMLSLPGSQTIVAYKEVTEEDYVANMNKLYYKRG